MKIMTYQYPKSSFLSIEKDMGTIINQMLKNIKDGIYITDFMGASNTSISAISFGKR